ncbi:MAG: rane fusion protein [Candidatus Binatota bacterium]|nr:rane fusion protein [Candidatus Binatota bacterium]
MEEATAAPSAPPPFLEAAPPHWVVRGLATLLISSFAISAVFAWVIHVPETVSSPFVLVPVHGTDPVRSSRAGVVTKVAVRDAEPVKQGEMLFVLQSAPIGDRSGELAAIEAELGGARAKIENASREYESQRLADQSEIESLRKRVKELEQILVLKRQQQTLTNELLSRYQMLRDKGFSSPAESIARQLEASQIAAELRQSELERTESQGRMEKLRHEMAMRATRYAELERREKEAEAKAGIRVATLRSELGTKGRSDLEVVAPCSGVVLRSRVKAPGAVVAEGALLSEIACSGEALEAELEVPPSGAGRLKPGQVVKLLYDAFPYQRYGVRYGKLRWVSPAAIRHSKRTAFRALVDPDDEGIWIDGEQRPFLPGMGGSARIVIGRRSLLSYAFGPIRQLRESLAAGPAPR